ncbi:MAG: hypothetical protein HC836_36020 [Richelia sp. RM2_1_2]|nr:hypothetical protein [Richelia sp. SM1_7_0]NJN12314.1 hypothetical protein [Richelia sp. RM1_1_1]NJO63428.1 hypothetical protein [Richelia sp. RM2_1_2]
MIFWNDSLYKQLDNTQPQPYKGTVESLISNAAYEKMESLNQARSQLPKKYSPVHPEIVSIDNQVKSSQAIRSIKSA